MAHVGELRIFSAEQILVPDEFPKVLKDFTKEIVRKSPEDIVKFGRLYFEQLLRDRGYFDDHLSRVQQDAKAFIQKTEGSVNDFYWVSGVIGDPSSSKARLGQHKKTNELRAIKIVDKATIDGTVEDYVKKIQLVASLDHPKICKYIEYFETDDQFFLVSEYLAGGDLWDGLMNFGGQYTEAIAATVTQQVLQALAYLHEKGLPHRNLRPVKILFVEQGKLDLKLVGFDVAGTKVMSADKIYGGREGHGPYYQAPEVFDNEYSDKGDLWSTGVILYFLLYGTLPFPADDFGEAIKQIQKGNPDLEGPAAAKNLSAEVKDLLRKLFALDPRQRPSAKEALQHPWFAKAEKGELDKKALSTTLDNIQKFNAGGKLKQALMAFMTTKMLSQQELNELARQFQAFDKSGDGYLSFEEVRQALHAVKGIDMNEQEAQELVKKVDADENGKINYAEFLMVSMNQQQLLTAERLEAAFKMFDENGDNEVSVDEIKAMLQSAKGVDDKMIKRAMSEVDRKGAKTALKFQEFKTMMQALFE